MTVRAWAIPLASIAFARIRDINVYQFHRDHLRFDFWMLLKRIITISPQILIGQLKLFEN